MTHTTVTPAYGRDYTSAKAAKKDWNDGKDFILQDAMSRWDGLPFNRENAKEAGFRQVNIRFNGRRKVVVINLN